MTVTIRVGAYQFGQIQMSIGQPVVEQPVQMDSAERVYVYRQPRETLSCRPDPASTRGVQYVVPASTL